MFDLRSFMIGTKQLDAMTDFYSKVVGKQPDMAEEGYKGWMVGSMFLSVMDHSEMGGMSKDPGRIMFNLETEQVKEEFDRVSAIEGAVVIKEPYQMGDAWIATLADPDGNYFQLMTPWKPQ